MKKTISLSIIPLLLALCACGTGGQTGTDAENAGAVTAQSPDESVVLDIRGSMDALAYMLALAENYEAANEGTIVNVTVVGGEEALEDVSSGQSDLAVFSVAVDDEPPGNAVMVAWQCIAVVLHPDNPVSDLTKSGLVSVLSGDISNWGDIGGLNDPISLYLPDTGEPLRQTLESILPLRSTGGIARSLIPRTAEIINNDADIAAAVAGDKGALGVVWASGVTSGVKAVAVDLSKYDDADYLLSRPIAAVCGENGQSILDFSQESSMREVVLTLGLRPVS